MGLYTENELRSVGGAEVRTIAKRASTLLKEARARADDSVAQLYDVFLCHSLLDADIILGIKIVLERHGLSVYVDWIEDSDLDRDNITTATAQRLRARMRQSKSLIFACSNNSPGSKWMPWELGYFDGFRGAVSVLPIAKSADESFKGQEFLGLYPYIDHIGLTSLFVNRGRTSPSVIGKTSENYTTFKDWLRTKAGVSA